MSIAKLKNVLPVKVYDELEECLNKNGITDVNMIAHFVAQTAHESGSFKVVYENLHYSTSGLLKVFPKYFKDVVLATAYARNPKKIANKVYANRMGNGDEQSGDGYKYRGRGYMHITGKRNYELFSNYIGDDCVQVPDLVATKYPMESAAWYFTTNKIWDLCKGSDYNSILAVTKRINGGTNGLQDRLAKFKTYFNILSNP